MTDPTEPPQPPAGYGAQPPAGYGAPPPPTPYQQPPVPYASWGQRAVATLWDGIVYPWPSYPPLLIGFVVLFVAVARESGALLAVGLLLVLLGIAIALWRLIVNYMLDQGRTGYTYGKRKQGIRTIRLADGQPAGVGSCVGRYFLHSLINQACYLDYLWPLWDPQQQTLTDKILSTSVIQQPDLSR